MKALELASGWYPIATAKAVRTKPIRRVFNGTALVLWRHQGSVNALEDICPHRGAALSEGTVIAGDISCPYHGWRFKGDGICTAMPALTTAPVKARANAVLCRELNGFIFVKLGQKNETGPQDPPLINGPHTKQDVRGMVISSLEDMAENILDTTHTSVVHQGFLRRSKHQRIVTPIVKTGPDWIEAHYPPAASPTGVVGKIIGGNKYHIIDRFRSPSVAEVEYKLRDKVIFAVRFRLSPVSETSISTFLTIAVAGKGMIAWVKILIVKVLFIKIFKQDRAILSSVSANRARFGRSPCFHAPQDIMRAGIESIVRGDPVKNVQNPPDLMI